MLFVVVSADAHSAPAFANAIMYGEIEISN